MPEEIEEPAAQQFDVGRYLDIARRRHLQFLIPLFIGWIVVWGSSWFLPARYKSSTLILVEEPTMPKNYVVPNVNDDLQERLQSIEQQILSRTRLLLIIDKLHLYANTRRVMTPDEKVRTMATKDTNIELVRDQQNGAITAFRVSYVAPDAKVAQEVTSELTSLFIDENARVREQQSEDTTEFIRNQLAGARAGLADQDAKVRAFQAAHEGALPSQQASNLQILNGLQAQLQSEQDALNSAKQQRVYAESLIGQYRSTPGVTQSVTGAPNGLAGIDQQLQTLRSKLAELSSKYTDRYPEVQQVKEEIAKTEKMREQLIATLKSGANDNEHSADSERQISQDPTQTAPLLQLQSQLKADEIEISNREEAINSLKARINEYQGRLSEEPAVEQQLADLTRGYEQSQTNYNDLLKKENESQMATSMEHLQEGERFTVLDPPSLPLKPDFPNHLKMCGVGLGAGMALGLIVLACLEFLDDRMHSDKEIKMLLSVPVVSEVPEIASASDLRRGKIKGALGWAVGAFVLLSILAGSAVSYLHG